MSKLIMEIILNGTPHQVVQDCNITTLVEQLELTGKRLAIEVNLEIIPRSQFNSHYLSSGDRVEIVHAIGGG